MLWVRIPGQCLSGNPCLRCVVFSGDYSSILSLLFCKEFDESPNSASEEFDASSPSSSSFFASWGSATDELVLCICRLCSETPISQERSHRVRRAVTDLLQCFDRWRRSALQRDELEADCCGWIQRQVQARASDLRCPNPQCGCKVGRIEGGSSGDNETLRVVLFRSCLLWECLLNKQGTRRPRPSSPSSPLPR